ncbi:hypothetical protein BGY98DRAFT_960126 [Russula aff. rugulosa BPL654]|nr:hypothetical protein BGY98DRAFT_960126 [Russula aff. rugulosa BPL654]
MTPGEWEQADGMDVCCLDLCIGMLEQVNGTFEENSTEGILGKLIVPAVKHKELMLHEKGPVCLCLCCLIAQRMMQTVPEVLKLHMLRVVFDVLMVHKGNLLANAH